MDDILAEFASLKISALSKSIIINDLVEDVTIGPNATPKIPSPKIQTSTVPNGKSPLLRQSTIKSPPPQTRYHLFQSVSLSNIERQRRKQELAAIDLRNQCFDDFHKRQEEVRREQWKQRQAQKLQEIQYQESIILKAMQQVEVDSRRELEELTARNKQRQKANNQMIEDRAAMQKLMEKLTTDILKMKEDISFTVKEIENILKTNQEAKEDLNASINYFKQLQVEAENICVKARQNKVNKKDLQEVDEINKCMKQLKDQIKLQIKECYQRREKEASEKVAQLRKIEEEKAAVKEQAEAEAKRQTTVTLVESRPDIPDDQRTLELFNNLQTFLSQHQLHCKPLVDDINKQFKQFKFDCKKSVNVPLNSIAGGSAAHLTDKYNKLHSLLMGRPIGDRRFVASIHPLGVPFCMDLLAKKFVAQGDLTVSSNPEAAFACAAVIISLWNDFPDFGKLLLAHFYQECPYLVPIKLSKTEQQSDEDFYRMMGYQYKEGQIEKQDKFLKRMTGISRLYFAIFMARPKRGQTSNPHNIKNGWTWFARTLNRPPYPDVTATLIYSFLEVAGAFMLEVYGKQFRKTIVYLAKLMMPQLKEVDSGGPVARLEVMLQEYQKTGRFNPPSGLLPVNFW